MCCRLQQFIPEFDAATLRLSDVRLESGVAAYLIAHVPMMYESLPALLLVHSPAYARAHADTLFARLENAMSSSDFPEREDSDTDADIFEVGK